MELPAVAASLDEIDRVLPLSDRIERTFTARVAALAPATRLAMLVAALNQSNSVAETLAATGLLLGSAAEPEILAPVVEDRLIDFACMRI